MKKDSKYMEDGIKAAMDAQKGVSNGAAEKDAARSAKQEKSADREKIAELTDDLKRVQAEFENYKKRVERDNPKLCDYAKAGLIKKLLTILDSFEMALKNTENHDEFVKGTELIYSQLFTLLKEEGLAQIETRGKKLDPSLHDVMLTAKSEEPEDTIIEELQKGYMLKGSVLRHSKVKVSKK